jgi:hypothetical protein
VAHPLVTGSDPKPDPKTLKARRAHAAADGDYLTTKLVPQGALLTGFKEVSQSSIANRIAMVTGQPPNSDTSAGCVGVLKQISVGDDFAPGNAIDPSSAGCIYPDSTGNLMDSVLGSSNYQMNIYVEANKAQAAAGLCSAPAVGSTVTAAADGAPDVRDNPFLWLPGYMQAGNCEGQVRSIDRLAKDLAADNADSACRVTPSPYGNSHCMPPVSLVIPSRCRGEGVTKCPTDGDATGAAGLDQFLARYITGTIFKSVTYKRDGLVTIGYSGADSASDPTASGPAGLLLLSPFVKPQTTDSTALTTYDLLYTLMSRLASPDVASFGDPTSGLTMLAHANPLPANQGGFAAREFPKSIYSKTLSPPVTG